MNLDERDFTGSFEHSLDDKGRLVVPRDLRDQLAPDEQLYLVPGEDNCLELLPTTAYKERVKQRRLESRVGGPKARMAARVFTAFADPLTIDRSGRISVPKQLRAYAGIDGPCVVNGAGEWIEIWSESRWRDALDLGSTALASPEDFE